jgi:adhesin transport system outer membrane protein
MLRPIVLLTALCCISGAYAQPSDPLRQAAQKAIQTNPEVAASFNALRAADNEIDVARGAYYPRVDVLADTGYTRNTYDSGGPADQSLNRRGAGVSVSQLLWDGLATRGEVGRLDHLKKTRYFQFVETTEQVALEAARAHYDVLRFRKLVQLAEDNYVQHKLSSDQIESRYKAGVGRGVDLEQAAARLALAEANLVTEVANLHDVMARYQRVVGEPPPAAMLLGAGLREGLPASASETLSAATSRNASISAAIENLRAIRAQADGQRGAYQPRVEARARTNSGKNLGGNVDQQGDNTAEIVMSWNIFNGGADQARTRQLADLLTQAADNRDRACRDVRQTAAIAFNDTTKLSDQIGYLRRNTEAIEKARDAYRQQFEIGQRSLLDLLNSENEVYTARRAYANAEHDLRISYARAHAAMNTLTSSLGLSRMDTGAAVAEGWQAEADAPGRCPVVDSAPIVTPRSELDARARALGVSRQAAPPAGGAAPAPAKR